MGFNFEGDMPIYLQIIEIIKMQIIGKRYLPNSKLPSVRALSLEYGINPNTIQKALVELEDMGLIYTESTNGKFVTNDENLILAIREQTIKKNIDKFLESMADIGINKSDLISILKGEK